jgi:hypothetical protein
MKVTGDCILVRSSSSCLESGAKRGRGRDEDEKILNARICQLGRRAALRQRRGRGGFWSENRPDLRLMEAATAGSAEASESVTITLRIDPRMLARIKRLARMRYLNYQSMIKQWLSERMEQELNRYERRHVQPSLL